MLRGQIASDIVMNASSFPEKFKKVDKLKKHLCSLACPGDGDGQVYPEQCRRCMCCGYGKRLLQILAEEKGQQPKKRGRPKGSKTNKRRGGQGNESL